MNDVTWVIFDRTTSRIVAEGFKTKRGANQSAVASIRRKLKRYFAAPNSAWGKQYQKEAQHMAENWDIVTLDEYNAKHRKTKVVRNLMTGKEIEIDINTPACCDPSTETYWSM